MNEKYSINTVSICPVETINNKHKKPLVDAYPELRLCVIDNENKFAIDVIHELKYQYIDTINNRYLKDNLIYNVDDGKRIAIFPNKLMLTSDVTRKMCEDVIDKLESGYIFPDGNEVLDNRMYLELLGRERKQQKSKIKKIIKRKN